MLTVTLFIICANCFFCTMALWRDFIILPPDFRENINVPESNEQFREYPDPPDTYSDPDIFDSWSLEPQYIDPQLDNFDNFNHFPSFDEFDRDPNLENVFGDSENMFESDWDFFGDSSSSEKESLEEDGSELSKMYYGETEDMGGMNSFLQDNTNEYGVQKSLDSNSNSNDLDMDEVIYAPSWETLRYMKQSNDGIQSQSGSSDAGEHYLNLCISVENPNICNYMNRFFNNFQSNFFDKKHFWFRNLFEEAREQKLTNINMFQTIFSELFSGDPNEFNSGQTVNQDTSYKAENLNSDIFTKFLNNFWNENASFNRNQNDGSKQVEHEETGTQLENIWELVMPFLKNERYDSKPYEPQNKENEINNNENISQKRVDDFINNFGQLLKLLVNKLFMNENKSDYGDDGLICNTVNLWRSVVNKIVEHLIRRENVAANGKVVDMHFWNDFKLKFNQLFSIVFDDICNGKSTVKLPVDAESQLLGKQLVPQQVGHTTGKSISEVNSEAKDTLKNKTVIEELRTPEQTTLTSLTSAKSWSEIFNEIANVEDKMWGNNPNSTSNTSVNDLYHAEETEFNNTENMETIDKIVSSVSNKFDEIEDNKLNEILETQNIMHDILNKEDKNKANEVEDIWRNALEQRDMSEDFADASAYITDWMQKNPSTQNGQAEIRDHVQSGPNNGTKMSGNILSEI